MDAETTDRLEKSFYALAHRGQELMDRFYALLFARHPQLRKMFPPNMLDQKDMYLAMLVRIVKGFRRPEALRQPLLELGRRHGDYGAQPQHYVLVRDTLIEVMSAMAGSAWNDALTRDWTFAMDFVSMVMLDGQREAASAAVNV